MSYPFPQGTLSIVEATTRASTRLAPDKNYREAWREICGGILKGIIPAYVLDRNGQSHEADRAQFAALGDHDPMILDASHQFASTTLESLDASGFPGKALIPGMTRISPIAFDVRTRHVSGRLFFLEREFDAAWWKNMEPKTKPEAVAKWLRGNCPTGTAKSAAVLIKAMQAELGIVSQRTLTRFYAYNTEPFEPSKRLQWLPLSPRSPRRKFPRPLSPSIRGPS